MKKFMTLLLMLALALTAVSAAYALPNPVTEITDDDEFEDILGIEFDADDLSPLDVAMSVIDNKIGQVTFAMENVNGESVDWLIRFTKDAETAADLSLFSGIYDEAMSEPIVISQEVTEDGETYTIEFTCVYAETENATIYTWQAGGVSYCVAALGEVSQMQLAALLDQVAEESIDD